MKQTIPNLTCTVKKDLKKNKTSAKRFQFVASVRIFFIKNVCNRLIAKKNIPKIWPNFRYPATMDIRYYNVSKILSMTK